MAQLKTDTTLQEVNIHTKHKISIDSRLNDFSPGQKVKTIDSATLQQYQMQSMANLLSQQVPVFVKSYGFNSLATLNFRGSSAAQSAVLWNGVPVQNAALGISDVSELPVALMNKVNIVYGGSAALWGSGNVGGALMIENDAAIFDASKNKWSVNGATGSFGQFSGGISAMISGKRWYFSGNVFAQSAQNNFPYTSLAGLKAVLPNSILNSEAILLKAAYKLNTFSSLSLTGWYQQYNREIPPDMLEAYSVKKQTDGSLRLLADWNYQSGSNKWYAKSSFIRDEIDYNDNAILLRTNNVVYQYYQETGWKKELYSLGRILLFIPFQASWLPQQGAFKTKQQEKVAIAAAWDVKRLNDRLDISINGRAESIFNKADSQVQKTAFLPGANASWSLSSWLLLRINAQYTYRTPSLNELYYFPGGNVNLKPERGWSEDAGYTVSMKTGRFSFYHDASLFNRNIQDWIIWLGGAIWTPHNIAEVYSSGIETENYLTYSFGHWQLHFGINTAYVLATTVASYIYNDGSIGKQIPYTPRYNGQANLGFSFRQLSLNYNHTYTGYRFTSSDESDYLLPYQTGNMQLMYKLIAKKHPITLTGQCNNVWNLRYQVVAFRPMPGIYWLIGLKADLTKSNDQ